jgi:hypothetical protein
MPDGADWFTLWIHMERAKGATMNWTRTNGAGEGLDATRRHGRLGALASVTGCVLAAALMAAGPAAAAAPGGSDTANETVRFHVENQSGQTMKLESVSPIEDDHGGVERYPFDVTHRPLDGTLLRSNSAQLFAVKRSQRKFHGFSSAVLQYRIEPTDGSPGLWVQYFIATNNTLNASEQSIVLSGCEFSTHELSQFTSLDLGRSKGRQGFQHLVCADELHRSGDPKFTLER